MCVLVSSSYLFSPPTLPPTPPTPTLVVLYRGFDPVNTPIFWGRLRSGLTIRPDRGGPGYVALVGNINPVRSGVQAVPQHQNEKRHAGAFFLT